MLVWFVYIMESSITAGADEEKIVETTNSTERDTAIFTDMLRDVKSALEDINMKRITIDQQAVASLTNRAASNTKIAVMAKLPKIIISKFDGTHIDWFRFWNQFEAEIDSTSTSKERDVVLIKGDERNRAQWRIGIVRKVMPGKDGKIRAVRLQAGREYLDRAPEHLFPLELQCDTQTNPKARDFRPRMSKAIAETRILDQVENESRPPVVE